MKIISLVMVVCAFTGAYAHNSYTGGYSGAPNRSTCASSCHGSAGGTLVVSGFPATYEPGKSYQVVVKHNGGSSIVNFNATTRIGTTTNVAGTFTTVTNCALYTGSDGGVYANPHAIDSAVFQWTAPAKGSGAVNFFVAGLQGITTSKNGLNSTYTSTASELTTDVPAQGEVPGKFSLRQNYPNPFNPTTTITFQIAVASAVRLAVFDVTGHEVATLVNEKREPGVYEVRFEGSDLSSGMYFCRLVSGNKMATRKMLLTK